MMLSQDIIVRFTPGFFAFGMATAQSRTADYLFANAVPPWVGSLIVMPRHTPYRMHASNGFYNSGRPSALWKDASNVIAFVTTDR